MPTEHEYKYVICPKLLRESPESLLKVKCDKHLVIEQGYLAHSKGYSSRIRKIIEDGKTKWFHTMKQKVSSRVIEIEKKLDERDGQDLWEYCVGKFKKDRYVFPQQGVVWELDIFKHDGQIYFMMAEVELPEGANRPKSKPDFLKNYILYEVPLSDDRFSNKRLGDIGYARSLCAKLSECPRVVI
jgi:CYTH domain-containing protein